VPWGAEDTAIQCQLCLSDASALSFAGTTFQAKPFRASDQCVMRLRMRWEKVRDNINAGGRRSDRVPEPEMIK
jgi:hypothetical protein